MDNASQPVMDVAEMSLSKLREMIKDVKIAMFTTADDYGRLRTCPLNTLDVEIKLSDAAELWFFTSTNSTGVSVRPTASPVSIAYSDPDHQRYISVSGSAMKSQDRDQIRRFWKPVHKSWFPGGVEDPSLALIHVQIEQAEYWDTPSSGILNAFVVAKSLISEEPYEPGLTPRREMSS